MLKKTYVGVILIIIKKYDLNFNQDLILNNNVAKILDFIGFKFK